MYQYLLIFIITFHSGQSLIGYDCGGSDLNITTMSLLDVGTCELPPMNTTSKEINIQLIQLSEYDNLEVMQCKIEIDRDIHYCGMHSHISVVQGGHQKYLMDISQSLCKHIHDTGALILYNKIPITGIKANSTTIRSITLAGTVTQDGSCTGTQYSDPYGTWNNVVVQAVITITLRNYLASVKLSTNQIILRSKILCPLSEEMCLDDDGAITFWKTLSDSFCNFRLYDILYEGLSIKTYITDTHSPYPEIYSLTSQDITFALSKRSEHIFCGYTLIKTEHPKLFIYECIRGHTFPAKRRVTTENLDLFAYINSKFVYVERHVRTQMKNLYHDVIQQKCNLEKQVLQNALSFATTMPDEFAYRIMKGPGYMAIVAGEVAHIIKCIPVECVKRSTNECYNELPVYHNNKSYFLSPKSHILLHIGTQKNCNPLLPVVYKIANKWYSFTPNPGIVSTPQILQPLIKPRWTYSSAGDIAVSGIYSEQDLKKLRDHIMFPVEQMALMNTITRGAIGERIPMGDISLLNLLDEHSIEQIAESAGRRMWEGFITFGTASAGVLGIWLTVRLIKLLIDTLIHGYSLYSIYGWSLHLIGAFWSSITHLLIQLAQGRPSENRKEISAKASDKATNGHQPMGLHQETSTIYNINENRNIYPASQLGIVNNETINNSSQGLQSLEERLHQTSVNP